MRKVPLDGKCPGLGLFFLDYPIFRSSYTHRLKFSPVQVLGAWRFILFGATGPDNSFQTNVCVVVHCYYKVGETCFSPSSYKQMPTSARSGQLVFALGFAKWTPSEARL